jgi:hypothetical protein
MSQELVFQGAIDALCQCALITVVAVRHCAVRLDGGAIVGIDPSGTGSRDPSERCAQVCFRLPGLKCHLEGLAHSPRMQRVIHVEVYAAL